MTDDDASGTCDDRVSQILAQHDVSRDGLGSTRIRVSDAVEAIVFDEGDTDHVELDLGAIDAEGLEHINNNARATLTFAEVTRLKQDLDAAFKARLAERERYELEFAEAEE